jgi:hypothetical protein
MSSPNYHFDQVQYRLRGLMRADNLVKQRRPRLYLWLSTFRVRDREISTWMALICIIRPTVCGAFLHPS